MAAYFLRTFLFSRWIGTVRFTVEFPIKNEQGFDAQERIYGLVIWHNRVILREIRGTAYMHILAFILMFVFGSIAAACSGDFSGLAAIGKFVGGVILVLAMMWLFTQPVLLVIVIVLLILIGICCSGSSK